MRYKMYLTDDVLVVDAMAIVHNITNELSRLDAIPNLDQFVNAQLTYMGSGNWWKGFKGLVPQVIMCWDSKPYWRHEYFLRDSVWTRIHPIKRKKRLEPAPIHYKGGRSMPPVLLNAVKAAVSERCGLKGWTSLKRMATQTHGYEADDLAALVVQVNRSLGSPKHVYLLTRDKDWMGMIGTDVTWLCCNTDTPRVRTLENYARCFGTVELKHPTDIWVYKSLAGDPSDNLPNCAGCPESAEALLPAISLFNPPEEYNLMKHQGAVLEVSRVLTEGSEVLHNPNAGERAYRSIVRAGLRPCIYPIQN